MSSQVIIVGAGIAGCALAILLAEQHNIRVSVYEKRPSMTHLQVQNGKSINMLLSPRGAKTLHHCGVLSEIRKRFPKIYGRMIHAKDPEEKPSFVPYSVRKSDGWFNTSVARNELIEVLVNKAKSLGVMFYFGYELINLDVRSDRVYCKLLNEGRTHSVSCDLVVGADGLYSSVRSRLPISSTRSITNYCYKELTVGPNADSKFAISPNAIHVFPRGRFFMIALPNEQKTFGCTLVMPEEDARMMSKLSNEQTRSFLRENFPDVYPYLTNIDSFMASPANPLWDVTCSDYDYKGRVVLIGDAAHTILPFLGQGMNLALEDSLIFSDLIKRFGDFSTAASEFTRLRKPSADAIQQLSESNFRELSRCVQSKSFQMRKSAELALHKIMPEVFAPSPFILANFAGLPYEKVKERVENSDHLMSEMIWYSKMFGVAVGTLLTGTVVKAKL